MKSATLFKLAAAAFSLSFMACSSRDVRQSEVPSVVINAVGSAYPEAANIAWEKEQEAYEAEFKINAKEYTVLLSATGNIVQTKYDIAATELPAGIRNAISSTYKNEKIDDVELLEKNGQTYYQVELESTLRTRKLVLNATGNEQNNISYWD